ncbi:hypothetical protein [Nonomuraea lactucae]|uniref:hypothetical protein n=1 Tax=Nonomuraea lactucae TaxID=2249762 RepID=UPI0013B46024|nr:hypothetical protein [Nonomuraea lactucae]
MTSAGPASAAAPVTGTTGTATGRRLRSAMLLVAVVAVVAAALGIGVRTSFGQHVSSDEPQYLLTALSLFEDGDLDVSDEIAERRWTAFDGAHLPRQTAVLADRRELSPHDPLLAVVLAPAMGLSGWVAAKATLTLLAGALAALVLWVAVRRFAVSLPVATAGVLVAFASAPFAVYGQLVFPELPAALAVTGAVAVLTGDRPRPVALCALVTALPWLSVKYVLPAALLAGLALVRWPRRGPLAAALAVMGALYLVVHRLVWGGWTVYASGVHFQNDNGEMGVMVGRGFKIVARLLRLVGLFADEGYGIATWQPAWLLLIPALVAVLRLRPANWEVLVAPLAGGWLVATFVASTMHGFWWPGRQLVVVLPLALLLVLWWLDRATARVRAAALVAGLAGVAAYGWLLADGYARRITWASEFTGTSSPVYRLIEPLLLPDYRAGFTGSPLPLLGWLAAIGLLAWYGHRTAKDRDELPALPR